MPVFSIIIPVYNVEEYLEPCLNSIISQTYSNYEVIIVNDGSTDSSLQICERYAKKNKKFKVFSNENQGISISRNFGIEKATGDFLIFIDSDDYLANNQCLEKIANAVEQETELVIYGFDRNEDIDKLHIKQRQGFLNMPYDVDTGEKYIQEIVKISSVFSPAVWRMAYNRKYWDDNGFCFPNRRAYEDVGLTWRVLCRAKKVSILREIIYIYRINRTNSLTKEFSKENAVSHIEQLKENYYLLQKADISKETKDALMRIFTTEYFGFLLDLGGRGFILDSETERLLKETFILFKRTLQKPKHFVVNILISVFGLKKGLRIIGKMRHILYRICIMLKAH